ncbi:MAG: RecQ family ATP-dependent DNA helicase [Gemmatimonadota bacterium]|nr:MAG: RecQ family ATP-dependent DNA helicase [Gemmatimonadota bacterium]
MWSQARSALERYFGYDDFRPGQREAILSVLRGRDTLIVMPTGGGKSLCYQIPALVLPGLTLVVSPLIALMLDQVAALERRGIAAALINSSLSGAEIDERLARAVTGELKLLYVAPERFGSQVFLRALREMEINLVAVDEAHCVSEWGHDFRPAYLELRKIWPEIGRPQLLALTATATPEVRGDIVDELDLREARVLVRGFDRPNLRLSVQREEKLTEKGRLLVSILDGSGASAVVYASTRKVVEAATELLRSAGVDAAAYHAGLPTGRRARVQEEWTSGRLPVVVATNAFGMGIDKEDVRRVVHFQMPGSLEAYYQEAGRAGRDGEPADCLLLHSYGDRFIHEFFIRSSYPPQKVVRAVFRALQAAVRSFGGPAMPAQFAHRVTGAKSEAEIHSALRILRDAGAVKDTAARSSCTVRWIASPAQVRDLIERESGGRDPPEVLPVLAGLARASAQGERRQFRLSRREIARWAGGDFATARAALDALQQAGILGWRDDSLRSGYVPSDLKLAVEALPVDWERVAARRALEIQKLRRMERYAYQGGCRRRYLLRYFGEHLGRSRCGGCDRCG